MTTEQVRHRRRRGLWAPVAGMALRHRDLRPGAYADAFAACLTWPDAVACLASAARVHRLPLPSPGVVQAVVPHRRRAQPGLRPYEYRLLDEDVERFGGAAWTTRERTVFDCLGLLEHDDAQSLLVWVLTRRLVPHGDLERMLDARPGLAGNRQRRELLDATRRGAMSIAEHRLHQILDRGGVGGWVADQPVRDRHGIIGAADVLFPEQRLVIEVDGIAFHGASRFQRDRTRQNRLVAAGYTVLRFTWSDLVDRPAEVLASVRQTLARLTSRPVA